MPQSDLLPKVSVLIANRNYGHFINECVDSVLNQDYPGRFEIIVYDDGSTDDSVEKLQRYGIQITLIARENHGRSHAFNQLNAFTEAFTASSGEILCLLDSDDRFMPDKLRHVIDCFQKHPRVLCVENQGHHIQGVHTLEERTRSKRWELHELGPGRVQSSEILAAVADTKRAFIGLPTSFLSFRRSYMAEILPMPADPYSECFIDVRLSAPLCFYGDFYVLDRPLTEYRIHLNNYYHRITALRMFRCNLHSYLYTNAVRIQHNKTPLPIWSNPHFIRIYLTLLNPWFWVRYAWSKFRWSNAGRSLFSTAYRLKARLLRAGS